MIQSGLELGLLGCHVCGKVARLSRSCKPVCPRCGSALPARKPESVRRTWAFLIAAAILYVPAMVLPVMRTTYLGNETADTILSGVVYFLFNGDWPLALIIFAASVLVPLMKMFSLAYLLVTVQRGSALRRKQRTVLYRATEYVGRWSMVDVFVIALLTALLQADSLVRIVPDTGAIAFCTVVVLTMIAAITFDPRLIWDRGVQRA